MTTTQEQQQHQQSVRHLSHAKLQQVFIKKPQSILNYLQRGPLKIQNGIPFREMELKSEMERHFLFGTSKCQVLH